MALLDIKNLHAGYGGFEFDVVERGSILVTMAVATKSKSSVSITITLPQIAEGLRKLSRSELETLELLLNKDALRTIQKSVKQATRGQLKEL